MPVFLVMAVGWLLRRLGILTEGFCASADQYVFKIALPVSLFRSIAAMDVYSDFDLLFCLYCFGVTVLMFLASWGLTALLMKDKRLIGSFAQAAVRSSAAILGMTFAMNISGEAGMVPMMILSAVPFFNIFSVVILSFSPHSDEEGNLLPREGDGSSAVWRACRNVLRNPIIIGILLGIPFALLKVQLPTIAESTLSAIGGTSSPVALLVIGATFSGTKSIKLWKPTALATFIKLVLLPALFLPPAALLGFRGSAMVAILIMTGAPTTVSSYVMAKAMKNDTVLASGTIVLTTLLSAVTITLWVTLLRSMALV